MKAAAPARPSEPLPIIMPERESPEKVGHIFGHGRFWRGRRPRSSGRKPPYWLKDGSRLGKIFLLVGLSLAIALILTPQPQKLWRNYKVGDIAHHTIRAMGDLLVEDVETTRQRQKELLSQIPPVFDLDEEAVLRVGERLHEALSFMRQHYQELTAKFMGGEGPPVSGKNKKPKFSQLYKELLKNKPEFDRLLGVSIPNSSFYLLAKAEFSPTYELLVNQVLRQFFQRGVIGAHALAGLEARQILVRQLPSRQEQKLTPPYPFTNLEEIRKPVANYCREIAADFSPSDRWLVCDLVQYLMVPNVSLNLAETQQRQQASLQELKPVYFKVKKGEAIVRQGERLTPLALAKLRAQRESYPQSRGILLFLGFFFSLSLLLGLSYYLAQQAFRHFPNRLRDLSFLAVLLFTCTLLSQALIKIGEHFSLTLPEVAQNLIYIHPIGLFAIFAAMFLGSEASMVFAFLAATLSAFPLEKPFPLFLYYVTACFTGIWGVRHFRQRGALIHTGLFICLTNVVMLSALKFLEYPFTGKDFLIGQLMAVSGGLLTGILALGLTPVIETGFGYASNFRLQELLNLDQPVLRELMLVAPGTYHHSLVVGQMVEAAAEAIGANSLLAKAAAYYHDIGKIKKPAYFVENQFGAENKHEKLAPSMSSLILISHIKDGVELARKHKLGDRIVDIIQQHHGRCLISYFYHKAKQQAANPQQVNLEDYRYPGPRPQTKEAGLVLIADQVEAASKTLDDPTPARIQGLVQKIINNAFADGQLDECELTLRELHLIAKSCNKILSGIFHQRISYPTPALDYSKSKPEDTVRLHDDPDKQPAKKGTGKLREPQEKNREDLRRLGQE